MALKASELKVGDTYSECWDFLKDFLLCQIVVMCCEGIVVGAGGQIS